MRCCIFHVDVNSAFLSWSAVKRLKEVPDSVDLRTIPSAVGGDVETRHGIITAKSVPAKKYGIVTGEPVVKALQKCPDLVLVPSDFSIYRKYSRALMSLLRTYTACVEQASIDEAYLDMTESVCLSSETEHAQEREMAQRARAHRIAEKLGREVREKLNFTVNIGISENKLLAKTASDFSKPDKIHTLYPDEVPEKLWPLPIGELHGCGHATAEKLTNMGIRTVGDAAHTDLKILQSVLGEKGGAYIFKSANGQGSQVVHGTREEAKGYSNETTTSHDITAENYEKEAPAILKVLSESVARRLQRDGVYASTIGVMVKTDDFHRHSRQLTLPESTNRTADITELSGKLMRELLFGEKGLFVRGRGVRLMGVSATNLDKGDFRQMNLFDYLKTEKKQTEKRARLDEMMQKIREKYGEDAVKKGEL